MSKVGISAIHFDVPKIYLPIKDLANARNIEPEKLEKGLGLIRMTLPDVHQDAVVFAANALIKLINTNQIKPSEISRIYVGTESGVDSSKPIGSYLIQLMEKQFGDSSFEHCDAVDFTFACISAVDAMQTCLDYVRCNPDKKAVVVATDYAKYDFGSGGEYTQGAGAVAMLIAANPKIIAFDGPTGVSTQGVFDFFKPRRIVKNEGQISAINIPEAEVEIFREQPVFDGHYSNECYTQRTLNAYQSLKNQLKLDGSLYERWNAIIMHLPYAFQARRMFTETYINDNAELLAAYQKVEDKTAFVKATAKSAAYLGFVEKQMAPAERGSSLIGNMYTASIFMGMLSTLCHYAENGVDASGFRFGFMAYGSGSKSKVFEGVVQEHWTDAINGVNLFEDLNQASPISFEEYVQLYSGKQKEAIRQVKNEFALIGIESEKVNLIGARYYQYIQA